MLGEVGNGHGRNPVGRFFIFFVRSNNSHEANTKNDFDNPGRVRFEIS